MEQSTRAPPGGHSTFSFGGDTADTGAPVSANRYARGSDQNSGNMMTGHPTTRVHAPPGGKSSIVFGDGHLPSPPQRVAKTFNASTRPPLPGESVQRGQMPTGGVQSHKFGTQSPTPHNVRSQPTFENKYRFSDVPSPLPPDYDAPPVGGRAEICLGTQSKDPPRVQEVPSWPTGASPYPAGVAANKNTIKNGEVTMHLPLTPTRENERLPPGGLQHNIFDRASLVNDPRMFRPSDENAPPASVRAPPGGRSNIIFGDERDSIPMVHKDFGPSGGAPRVLEEKIEQMQRRAPPGGVSTISLG
ncbi:unnamed protein product [Amoebophrya sp. A120]|nr:unnamed protein product [Amoebophrya sp. A120]|eukprot:GSA120T00000388001.1